MSLSIGSYSGVQAPTSLQPEAPLNETAGRAPVADGVERMFAAVQREPAANATGTRELVASEDSVTAGGVRDAYDLKLYHEADGSYTLEVDMKIEFDFQEGPNGETWTADEKQKFIEDYKQSIESAWSGRSFTTDDGQQVKVDINLDVQEQRSGLWGGVQDMFDGSEHWNIDVVKIAPGTFNQSYVTPGQNSGRFDSEDVNPVPKGATDPQVGAAHEFGHMIGLPDEYNGNGGPVAANDTDSIMHTGMDVRERHWDIVETWVEAR